MSNPVSAMQRFVVEALKKMGAAAPQGLVHTLALQGGRPVAHKFRYEGGYAIWLAGSNVVDFYDDKGKLLTSAALLRRVEAEAA